MHSSQMRNIKLTGEIKNMVTHMRFAVLILENNFYHALIFVKIRISLN